MARRGVYAGGRLIATFRTSKYDAHVNYRGIRKALGLTRARVLSVPSKSPRAFKVNSVPGKGFRSSVRLTGNQYWKNRFGGKK